MHFGLTEEQEMLQETVRSFAANECPPARLREIFDGGTGSDPALWRGMAEMGLAGLMIPEEFGGAELEMLELAIVAEELGTGAMPAPFLGHAIAALALVAAGSADQKSRWLPQLATGEAIATVAFAETPETWSPQDWTTAVADRRLSGQKLYVPHADLAHLIVVGTSDGSLALVERSARGLSLESMHGIDRSRPIFRASFDGTPCDPLQADAVESQRILDGGRILLAADSFGAASQLVRISTEYAKTRRQFGFPIAQFQAVKHQLARLAVDIEPTRSLYWYAAYAFDHIPEDASRYASLSKAHISDRAMETARAAVELWGGLGFTWECDVQIWFKRVMFDRAFLGAPEQLRERSAELAEW